MVKFREGAPLSPSAFSPRARPLRRGDHARADNRRRLKNVQTYRGPPSQWSASPAVIQPAPLPGSLPTFQLLLQDEDFAYDSVNNPVEIRDWRIADEWPAGAKPVTRKIQYDDLNRVRRVDYQYAAGDDTWTSPFEAENSGTVALQDPRRATPSPHSSFTKRPLWQAFEYDWLGNTSKTDDDAGGFYDRSLGSITNNLTGGKPYQLTAASNKSGTSSHKGELSAKYDAAGHLVRLTLERTGPCLPASGGCNQIFEYQWDEVGRLAEAARWDLPTGTAPPADGIPSGAVLGAKLRHAYDAGDQRVLKTAIDSSGAERHTVYVFGSLELRRAAYGVFGSVDDADYELSKTTEVPYLFANGVRLARVAWEDLDVPSIGQSHLHVLFELGDHLGSTSVVLDRATSELVERSTFQAYGAAESDYRPARWAGFREDYRFTGKEEDVEVGLQYFGKRYYAPLLNRWVSADPLAVHVPGRADFNLYAYVSGRALKSTDPLGLETDEQGNRVGTTEVFSVEKQFTEGGNKTQLVSRGISTAVPAASGAKPTLAPGGAPPPEAAAAGVEAFEYDPYQTAGQRAEFVEGFKAGPRKLATDVLSAISGGAGARELQQDLRLHFPQTEYGWRGAQAGSDATLTLLTLAPSARGAVGGLRAAAGEAAGARIAAAEQTYIYRGVHAGHPAMADALKGRVVPGDVFGTVTAEEHTLGNVAARSPFTSWTHRPDLAIFYANRAGPGGIVLKLPTGAPPPGATWSWELAGEAYAGAEQEVLLRGIREGATVLRW